jgi:hypothetical protein
VVQVRLYVSKDAFGMRIASLEGFVASESRHQTLKTVKPLRGPRLRGPALSAIRRLNPQVFVQRTASL